MDDARTSETPSRPLLVDDDVDLVLHELRDGVLVVRRFPLSRGRPCVVGSVESADVVIAARTCGRKICAIEVTHTGNVFVVDYGSGGGTWMHGRRLFGDRQIEHGDTIYFADQTTRLTFQQGAERGTPTAIELDYRRPM